MLLCFPIGCLKGQILIGAFLTVLIALGMVVATVQREKIIDKTDVGLTNKALVGMYVSSILLLLIGLSGSLKKNRCLLELFSVGTCVFIVVFLMRMFIFFLGPNTIFDGTCQQPNNALLIDLKVVNQMAQNTLCHYGCPCDYHGDPPVILNCNDADIIVMETFEKEFKYGSWCEGESDIPSIYYFSDINAVPELFCHTALKNFFEKYSIILGVSCSVAFSVALLNIIRICCFCFHPSRNVNKRALFHNLLEDN